MYTKLAGLRYRVVYKAGATNQAADALSRHPAPPVHIQAISYTSPDWLTEVVSGYDNDKASAKLLQSLAVSPDAHPPYSLRHGVIYLKDKVWVGDNPTLQLKIITALHDSAIGGHSGFPVTYGRIRKLFAWRGMKSAVRSFVASCTVCIQAKPDRAKYPSLLSPLPVPSESWQMISMDFIEGLPRSGFANCILVVVDRFSKFSHFIPLLHPFTAQ
jgi:hypothetical protein